MEKSQCVNYVTTIAPILKIERHEWGALGILQVIDDGLFVWTCKVFSDTIKTTILHAFVYDIHFLQLKKSEWYVAIIDNRSYAPISVLD